MITGISRNIAHGGYTRNFIPRLLNRPEVMRPVAIDHIEIVPLNARLTQPFPIASDRDTRLTCIDNVLIALRSRSGTVGYGEAAPFHGIAGDTQQLVMSDLSGPAKYLAGSALTVFELEAIGREALGFPSARAALEMAFFDVLAREEGVPLASFLNPEVGTQWFTTDITIPLVAPARAAELAERFHKGGFSCLKVNVGEDVQADIARLYAIDHVLYSNGCKGETSLVLDANEGYDLNQLTTLLFYLERKGIVPSLIEQPVKRHALGALGMAKSVAELLGSHVIADESVFDVNDAVRVIESGSADGINLKIMKHGGIIEAMRIAEIALDSGLMLMVGGMVETRLAMTASLHMGAALGDVHWFDLDTPIFIEDDGLMGGLAYDGPRLTLPGAPGIGVSRRDP